MRNGKTLIDYPGLLKEWDYGKNVGIDPRLVHIGSNKKYFWKCDKCHQVYAASSYKKAIRGYGCPVCSNHLVVKGVNDFESCYPNFMLDWNYDKNINIDASKLSKRSNTIVAWKCHKCGHEWSGTLRGASEKKINCPRCSKKEMSLRRHNFELEKNGCLTDEELLKDWDYSKNNVLPSDVAPKSNKYIFWKCHKCGYEWKSKLNNRAYGRGCPCCGNKVVVSAINDLGTTDPELAKEWHPTKNGDLTPSSVTRGMGKKVWWICPLGHEYEATILSRSSKNGTGCPICNSGRQTSFREQAIYYYVKKMYPDAISRYKPKNFERFELDIYIPSINTAIEYDGVAWHKDNKFDRERRKYQLCKNSKITLIRIKEKMPEELGLELADEIISSDDFETESGFTLVIHKVLERIDFKEAYSLNPLDVNLSRDRFEIKKYATEIKHSFADVFPTLALEWHPTKNGTLKPTMFKPKSNFKAWWKCSECGEEYESTLTNRANGCGCPKCSIKYSHITQRNNLIKKKGSISNERLIEEWNYEKNGDLKPTQFTNYSETKVWWKCSKCGYEWAAKIKDRSKGTGCPKCAGFKLFVGFNDFATVHPDLLCEWDYSKNTGIDPYNIHRGSNKSVWWKCSKCGYEYKAPIARRDKGSGCRKCADKANAIRMHKKALSSGNTLGDLRPDLIQEFSNENNFTIFDIAPSSHTKIKWVCSKCGYKWEAPAYSRYSGTGCPVCAKIKSRTSNKKY